MARVERGEPQGLLDNPHPLLIRTSLALALGVGFSLGLYMIVGFAFGLPLTASTPMLMQVHGQVQALGFIALFIMAVGVQLFPRFHASRLDRPRLVSIGGLMLAAGLVLRTLAQPASPAQEWRGAALIVSGLLQAAGVGVAVYAFARVIRASVPSNTRREARLLPFTLGGSLVLALALNIVACWQLAQGALLVPSGTDEALLHLELWGFATTMVLAVAGRIFPRFLLLQATRERVLVPALICWAIGSFGVALTWLVPAVPLAHSAATLLQLAGAMLYVVALRLYETPLRASGMPHVTNPTRLWARVAFLLMLVAAAANFGLAVAADASLFSALTQLSAARHALAQGFLLPVIVVMAARILPGYSGYMLHRTRLLAGMVWALLAGAGLRFVGEFYGGYAPGWGGLTALGGTLAVGAFCVFAFGLWRSTGRAPSLSN